jgi:DNA-binding NarL/FixJ family response regulator
MPGIRVLVVDDHAIIRQGLRSLLELEEDIAAVGEASSAMEGLEKIAQHTPDVVFMDLKMPGVSGIEATRLIKGRHPQVKVVLLTNYDDKEYVVEAIQAGADGYVLKNVERGDLINIVHTVLRGQAFIDRDLTNKVFQQIKSGDASRPFGLEATLSPRELEILIRVVGGDSNKDMADALHISSHTVKTHLKKLYQKLGVNTRSQAVKKALEEGIIHTS